MTSPRMVAVLVVAVIKQSKWTKALLYFPSKRRVQQGSFTEGNIFLNREYAFSRSKDSGPACDGWKFIISCIPTVCDYEVARGGVHGADEWVDLHSIRIMT